jgi:multiple sugar transport system permease protein
LWRWTGRRRGPILASLLAASLGTVIAMTTGTAAAYWAVALGLRAEPAARALQLRLFPADGGDDPRDGHVVLLPLMDTWYGLALIYGIVTLPFAFWLMKTSSTTCRARSRKRRWSRAAPAWRVFTRIHAAHDAGAARLGRAVRLHPEWSDYLIALLLTSRTG